MPDEKWLQNEPQSWHSINRALQDIASLLAYLGSLPEGRLMSYFDDTQGKMSSPAARTTLPPCPSYPEFLNRLTEIGSAFQTGGRPPAALAGPAGRPPLSPEGFVFWSRDFLAAVAAPATAQSIRLTQDYVVRRARAGGWWRRFTRPAQGGDKPNAEIPVLAVDPDDTTSKLSARRLAIRVRNYEWITIVAVAFTVMVSIYALSGRLILGREKDARDAFTAIDAQVQSQEDKIFASAKLPIDEPPQMNVVALCSFTKRKPVVDTSAVKLASLPDAQGGLVSTASAETKSGPQPEYETTYLSAFQAHICPQRDQILRSLFVATMHLQSWSSVVTQSFEHGLDLGIKSYTIHFAVPLAPIFGVVPSTLNESARENDGILCKRVAPELMAPGAGASDGTSAACERVLWTLINQARNVAESILGSITQYILPVCYGFLGAMAAAMRLLRRKIDASLLNFTDRSRLQQGAILGVLCGGVIGLFASYIGNSDPAGGLGLSAIALLAGYNVDGVFRFLDELSDRIFRPVTPPRAG